MKREALLGGKAGAALAAGCTVHTAPFASVTRPSRSGQGVCLRQRILTARSSAVLLSIIRPGVGGGGPGEGGRSRPGAASPLAPRHITGVLCSLLHDLGGAQQFKDLGVDHAYVFYSGYSVPEGLVALGEIAGESIASVRQLVSLWVGKFLHYVFIKVFERHVFVKMLDTAVHSRRAW